MKTPIGIGILEHAVSVFIMYTKVIFIFICTLLEIVTIDEVVAGVVRRVDINHLYLAEIALL